MKKSTPARLSPRAKKVANAGFSYSDRRDYRSTLYRDGKRYIMREEVFARCDPRALLRTKETPYPADLATGLMQSQRAFRAAITRCAIRSRATTWRTSKTPRPSRWRWGTPTLR